MAALFFPAHARGVGGAGEIDGQVGTTGRMCPKGGKSGQMALCTGRLSGGSLLRGPHP